MSNHPFSTRKLLIASMHGKEQAIGPVLRDRLSVFPLVATGLDTDTFGTFSGEVERLGSPVDALRKKCVAAHQLHGMDLVVASEGSFGPHRYLPFGAAGEEFLMLKDFANHTEVVVKELFVDTNYATLHAGSLEELEEFARRIGFPAHALILRGKHEGLVKGIAHWESLREAYVQLAPQGEVGAETDMRAHLNPTRLKNIEALANKLVDAALQFCPACNTPGFVPVAATPGLPCSACSYPTRSTLALVYGCSKCGHQEEVPFPRGKREEDPMYCDHCNP